MKLPLIVKVISNKSIFR